MHRYLLLVLLLLLCGLTACTEASKNGASASPSPSVAAVLTPSPSPSSSSSPTGSAEPGMTMTPSGLQYQDIEAGDGMRPLFNQTVRVRYTGTMKDGTKFDSNVDNDRPALEFKLGRAEVIKGWEIGIGGGAGIPPMRVGGRRKLIVPPELGYGSEPYGTIPGKSTLIFDVTLVGIKK